MTRHRTTFCNMHHALFTFTTIFFPQGKAAPSGNDHQAIQGESIVNKSAIVAAMGILAMSLILAPPLQGP